MAASPIALLTDFGISDPYVGIMKGVISGIAPQTLLIDLTHLIPQGDIQQGAYYLWQASRDFPPGTVFLAVVDPGVGTSRKGLYLLENQQIFIGPDNGLFSYLTINKTPTAWELSNPRYQLDKPSSTFQGRDIFAPAAALASLGIQGSQFGSPVTSLEAFPRPICLQEEKALQGEIISVDHFGNLVSSLGIFLPGSRDVLFESWVSPDSFSAPVREITVVVDKDRLPLVSTFAEIPPGKCGAIIGSTGLLELAAKNASASTILNMDRGDRLTLTWE